MAKVSTPAGCRRLTWSTDIGTLWVGGILAGMRIVLLTWREAGARTLLQWAATREHEVVLVVTSKGRRDIRLEGWKAVSDLVPWEVPIVISSHPAQFADAVRQQQPDLVLSFMYPHLVDDHTIEAARIAALNVHPGRLPQYRGANPFWAIYRQEREFTLTVHRLAHGFDIGSIMATEDLPVGDAPTAEGILAAMLDGVPRVLDAAVAAVLAGEPGIEQPAGDFPEWHLFTESDGHLDWDASVRSLLCRHAACTIAGMPVVMAVDGVPTRIRALRPVADLVPLHQPGTILSRLGNDAIIVAADGILLAELDSIVA